MDDEGKQIFSEELLREVALEKARHPGLFVSNWEDDESGIVPEEPTGNRGKILHAAEYGISELAEELLDYDPSLVSASDRDGYTPLHRACYNNHSNLVKLLLTRGANPEARTEMGWQPLHCCARWGNSACAKLLIETGRPDVNARTNGNLTPLHLAAACKEEGADPVGVAELLLRHPQIDITIVSDCGETARDVARQTSEPVYLLMEELKPVNR